MSRGTASRWAAGLVPLSFGVWQLLSHGVALMDLVVYAARMTSAP